MIFLQSICKLFMTENHVFPLYELRKVLYNNRYSEVCEKLRRPGKVSEQEVQQPWLV